MFSQANPRLGLVVRCFGPKCMGKHNSQQVANCVFPWQIHVGGLHIHIIYIYTHTYIARCSGPKSTGKYMVANCVASKSRLGFRHIYKQTATVTSTPNFWQCAFAWKKPNRTQPRFGLFPWTLNPRSSTLYICYGLSMAHQYSFKPFKACNRVLTHPWWL